MLDRIDPLLAELRAGVVEVIAIDCPIGLLNTHPRPADVAARARLGPRRSSVFPTPIRATLGATDYDDACARSRAVCGKALSRQAFNLLDRIRVLDELIEPTDQDRLVEAHPELAFARLAGAPLDHNKYRAEGAAERRRLAAEVVGSSDLDRVLHQHHGPDPDVLDAISLLSVAARVLEGREERLGTTVDSTGKRAEIVL